MANHSISHPASGRMPRIQRLRGLSRSVLRKYQAHERPVRP